MIIRESQYFQYVTTAIIAKRKRSARTMGIIWSSDEEKRMTAGWLIPAPKKISEIN
jgi:hypothetical protein